MNKILKTNNNSYLYNAEHKELMFLPKNLFNVIESNLTEGKNQIHNNEVFYYKKSQFLEKKWIESAPPKRNYINSYKIEEIEKYLCNSRYICFEVTTECNLNCRYCIYGCFYERCKIHERIKKMNFKTSKLLIDFILKKWSTEKINENSEKTISFYGGEPLLNFTLIKEIVEYLDNHKHNKFRIRYNMTTNGLLLSRYIDFLSQKKFSIMISLDGSRWNNSLRLNHSGEESYDVLLANLETIKKGKPKFFSENISFNSVLHARNSLEEIVEFFRLNFPKNKIQISPLSSNNLNKKNAIEFRDNIMAKDLSIDKRTYLKIEKKLRIGRFVFYSDMIMKKLNFNYNNPIDLIIDNENKIPTGTCLPFEKLFVTANGEILPCERCDYPKTFGTIDQNGVNIDYENVANIYGQQFKCIISLCEKCHYYDICKTCVFNIKDKYYCPNFKSKSEINENLSTMISDIEDFDFIF